MEVDVLKETVVGPDANYEPKSEQEDHETEGEAGLVAESRPP